MAKPRSTRLLKAPDDLADAAALLRAGGLVAFPTETVYGLGADATQGTAVAGIYEAKGRPSFNPLIAHVADLQAAQREAVFNEKALALAHAFWPGPLTLVLPVAPSCSVSSLARAGLDSIGIRIPNHPVALALLRHFEHPIVAPSANRSGHVSPTLASHVLNDLSGRIDAVIEGGATEVGVESTIISCLDDRLRLLRPGAVTRAQVEALLAETLLDAEGDALIAPGMMQSHYAPNAPVLLNATSGAASAALLDFGGQFAGEPCLMRIDLSPGRDLEEAAARLFDALRQLDAVGASQIRVALIPVEGLGEAIADRLARAAAPR